MGERRFTIVRNVKLTKGKGITAIVQFQAELCTVDAIMKIIKSTNNSFSEHRVGLDIGNDIIQYKTANMEEIGYDLENSAGETVNSKRISFIFTNGNKLSEDDFKDIIVEIFTNVISEFDNVKVDINFVNSDTIKMEHK